MKRLAAVLGLALAICQCANLSAQTIRGAGARPCNDWSRSRVGGGHFFDAEEWVLGYLTGNRVSQHVAPGIEEADQKGVFQSIDAFCTAHPTAMIWQAIKDSALLSHGS
jgi:hypothetical protein